MAAEPFKKIAHVRFLVEKNSESELEILMTPDIFMPDFQFTAEGPRDEWLYEFLDSPSDQIIKTLPRNVQGMFEIVGEVWGRWQEQEYEPGALELKSDWEIREPKIHLLNDAEIKKTVEILELEENQLQGTMLQ